jgi:hypothetical protein
MGHRGCHDGLSDLSGYGAPFNITAPINPIDITNAG